MQNNMNSPERANQQLSDPELTRLIAAYVISIGPNGAPSGEVYIRNIARVSLDKHNGLVAALQECGWITQSHHYLRLTELGLAKHAQIAAVLMKMEVAL